MAELEAQSPAWWLSKLYPRLIGRLPEIQRYEDYYDGRHPLTFVTSKYRAEFGKMLQGLSDNWMALVVDAVEERLHVDGFRFGDDTKADDAANDLWQANFLDADSELLHSKALTAGVAYAMVWAGEDRAEITVEDPSQTIVAYETGSRRRRIAGLKCWNDEWTGKARANVYLRDGIWKFEAKKTSDQLLGTARTASTVRSFDARWTPVAGDEMVPNPIGEVPIVEFRNRPRLLGTGRSEIRDVTSTQDQINKLVCDMMVAAEFSAFRQRWATGIEVATDPDTGLELEDFKASIDRLWHVPNDLAHFGEFSETNLRNYVAAIENRVQSLASRTRTPPHYLLGNTGSFPSGESLKATETGLVAKVHSRQRHFGESWEETIRLAFLWDDDPRADEFKAETIWQDPESRTESEHVDALVKLRALNVPLEQLWEDAGYTPQQIARFKTMLLDEALNQSLAGVGPNLNPGPAIPTAPEPQPIPA